MRDDTRLCKLRDSSAALFIYRGVTLWIYILYMTILDVAAGNGTTLPKGDFAEVRIIVFFQPFHASDVLRGQSSVYYTTSTMG